MKLAEHPTVKAFYEKAAQAPTPSAPTKLDANWLRQLCLEAGADDGGLVEISRPALAISGTTSCVTSRRPKLSSVSSAA